MKNAKISGLLLFVLFTIVPVAAHAQDPAGSTAPVVPPATVTATVKRSLLTPGMTAPDFMCVGADGKEMKLSELRGKIVILDFWASWCIPCQHSMPHLERVYQQVKGKNVTVLALCVRDDEPSYEKWRVDHKADYTFPVAFDPAAKSGKSTTYAAYGVPGIPTQYVIDKDGIVTAAYVGFLEGDNRLEKALATLGVTVPVATKTASK